MICFILFRLSFLSSSFVCFFFLTVSHFFQLVSFIVSSSSIRLSFLSPCFIYSISHLIFFYNFFNFISSAFFLLSSVIPSKVPMLSYFSTVFIHRFLPLGSSGNLPERVTGAGRPVSPPHPVITGSRRW